MKISAKEVLTPTLTLFLICLITTALLSGTNLLTRDSIERQKREAEENARRVVLSTAESFELSADGSYYIGKRGGDDVGYVFTTSAKGYGGDLEVMTGIGADGKVTGVSILSQNETPGLGANAEKEDFRGQYLQAVPEKGFSVVKSGSPADGEIQAMTGATITSSAVTDAVNQAVSLYREERGKTK